MGAECRGIHKAGDALRGLLKNKIDDELSAMAARIDEICQEVSDAIAGGALRGLPSLHRQLALSHGLLCGDKLLSPVERRILRGLIGGETEKAIALSLGQKPATLHKYVSALYARLGVSSRAELAAYWLAPPAKRVIRRATD